MLQLWSVPISSICDSQTQSMRNVSSNYVTTVDTKVKNDILVNLQEKCASDFKQALGLCTKIQVSLFVAPEVKPATRPKRPVLHSAVPLLDAGLNRLKKLGMLTNANYSAWATPIVVVQMVSGTVRICGDFSTGLNIALQTHQCTLPIPIDSFA
ncbi:unnamed protein product [Dicrocoelium dendriticum]|nr:unnamed protein product [Dicrocoelium dendriticum]